MKISWKLVLILFFLFLFVDVALVFFYIKGRQKEAWQPQRLWHIGKSKPSQQLQFVQLDLDQLPDHSLPQAQRTEGRKTGGYKAIKGDKSKISEKSSNETLSLFENDPGQWTAWGYVLKVNQQENKVEIEYNNQPEDCQPVTDFELVRVGKGMLCGIGEYEIEKIIQRTAVCVIGPERDCPSWQVGINQIEIGDFVWLVGPKDEVLNQQGGKVTVYIFQ